MLKWWYRLFPKRIAPRSGPFDLVKLDPDAKYILFYDPLRIDADDLRDTLSEDLSSVDITAIPVIYPRAV